MMLDIHNVSFQYKNFSCHYELTACESDLVVISGNNGSGKTTLFMLIAGFLTPTDGQINWKSRSMNRDKPEKRPVSMVFQKHNLFPHLTVEENIALGFPNKKTISPEQHAELNEVLVFFELMNIQNQYPAHLSGGQMQRVALARSMIRHSPIMLLDEPLNHLDTESKDHFIHWINLYLEKEKPCILVASHHIPLFNHVMTHHYHIENGQTHKIQ